MSGWGNNNNEEAHKGHATKIIGPVQKEGPNKGKYFVKCTQCDGIPGAKTFLRWATEYEIAASGNAQQRRRLEDGFSPEASNNGIQNAPRAQDADINALRNDLATSMRSLEIKINMLTMKVTEMGQDLQRFLARQQQPVLDPSIRDGANFSNIGRVSYGDTSRGPTRFEG